MIRESEKRCSPRGIRFSRIQCSVESIRKSGANTTGSVKSSVGFPDSFRAPKLVNLGGSHSAETYANVGEPFGPQLRLSVSSANNERVTRPGNCRS